MKILVLGSYAPSLVNFRGPLIHDLIDAGCRVTACAPGLTEPIRRELQAIGAEAREVPLGRTGTNPLSDWACYAALRRLFRETGPDIVFAYTAKPVIYGMLAAKAAGVPRRVALITGLGYAFTPGSTTGGGIKRRALRALLSALYRRALAQAGLVVFQNPDDRADFQRLGIIGPRQACLTVAGSGIDLKRFPACPVPQGPPVFLMIARLVADKGIRELVEAAGLLKACHPTAEIRLVGPHDDNPAGLTAGDLRRLEHAGLIRYLGEAQDVRPHLAQCTVYVLPSYYREGTPRTVLEAMATGRAIITTDAPGCRQTVVEGGNGVLVPVRDAPALARAMARYMETPGLAAAHGRESRRLAEERFDVHQVNREMMRAMGVIA